MERRSTFVHELNGRVGYRVCETVDGIINGVQRKRGREIFLLTHVNINHHIIQIYNYCAAWALEIAVIATLSLRGMEFPS